MISAYRYPEPQMGPDALAARIADTRAALGDTLSSLAAKADVKTRVSDQMARARTRTTEVGRNAAAEVAGAAEDLGAMMTDAARGVRRNPLPLAGVAAGAVVVAILIARGRRR